MKIKTQGKCLTCGEICNKTTASTHLLKCITSAPTSSAEGFLVRVAGAGHLDLYWMFIAVPNDSSLSQLDRFLRDIWLECCGHLSEFMIGGRHYMSHTESGNPSTSMRTKVSQLFSPGMEFEHVYDMGSSTELDLKVIKELPACPKREIALLMRNDPPPFSCTSCKKAPEIICSQCGETTCTKCSKKHSCAAKERDTYMLMPLVNSPRAGVCGYG